MAKIIDINKHNDFTQSDELALINIKSAQEDFDEKVRVNKRKKRWDNLLYIVAILIILNSCGIIHLQINLPSIIPIAIKVFQCVSKINSS